MNVTSQLPSREVREKRRRIRGFKDKTSRFGITAAGYGVVFSLALIFLYLFYEVLPILKGADMSPITHYEAVQVSQNETPVHVLVERYQELGVNFTQQGTIRFFQLNSGVERLQTKVSLARSDTLSSFAAAEPIGGLVAYGS